MKNVDAELPENIVHVETLLPDVRGFFIDFSIYRVELVFQLNATLTFFQSQNAIARYSIQLNSFPNELIIKAKNIEADNKIRAKFRDKFQVPAKQIKFALKRKNFDPVNIFAISDREQNFLIFFVAGLDEATDLNYFIRNHVRVWKTVEIAGRRLYVVT
jgi:hypothetical protein